MPVGTHYRIAGGWDSARAQREGPPLSRRESLRVRRVSCLSFSMQVGIFALDKYMMWKIMYVWLVAGSMVAGTAPGLSRR